MAVVRLLLMEAGDCDEGSPESPDRSEASDEWTDHNKAARKGLSGLTGCQAGYIVGRERRLMGIITVTESV